MCTLVFASCEDGHVLTVCAYFSVVVWNTAVRTTMVIDLFTNVLLVKHCPHFTVDLGFTYCLIISSLDGKLERKTNPIEKLKITFF